MIFGDLPISPEKLVKELQICASKIADKLDPIRQSNKTWTYAIKSALEEMGKELGFKQFFSNSEQKVSEFMLDAVWFQSDESGNAAVLGVESEWGNPWDKNYKSRAGCVVNDFEKLLQFKAPMKLMIFQAENAEMRKAIHHLLLEYLRAFRQHIAGETYLFMEFSSGHCFSYICEIQRDGRDTSLHLKAMTSESAQILQVA